MSGHPDFEQIFVPKASAGPPAPALSQVEGPCPFKAKNRERLETIRRTSPQSLAELAGRTGRKKPNLSRTLKTMEQYGLVQLSRHKGKLVPRVRYQRVAVLMELSA